jgi:Icc-related predicted phosphoesterase
MKVWFISDTHNQHRYLTVPDVDLVIHCGDESNNINATMNEPEARDFFEWYTALSIREKIYVPGNHSSAVEHGLVKADQYPAIRFLIHESLELGGKHIFGSPYTPRFHEWSYMKKRTQLDAVWQTIPERTDILITHGPPKGVLDITHDSESNQLVQVGCAALRRHVEERVKPTIHAFGHIHDEKGVSNYGKYTRHDTLFVNCSVCDLQGRFQNNGFVLTI